MAREQFEVGESPVENGQAQPSPDAILQPPNGAEEVAYDEGESEDSEPTVAAHPIGSVPASEADALRDDPESGRLLAEHMEEARYQPVILFGNAASGKTSLILSLIAAIKTDARLDAGLFLGDPILDTSKKYGEYLWEQATQFFGLKTQQFIEGAAAPRTNIELPFFIPLIFRPSGKPEARVAFMESNGEWYRSDRQSNRFFPPLRRQIEDFLRHYSGGILFVHLLPYTQRHLYTNAPTGGNDASELQEASLAVSGALQAYENVRLDKSNDRHLVLVTKWDAHKLEDGDPLEALHDDPQEVRAFVGQRYSQALTTFRGLGLAPFQMAMNGYCAGQISANNVIRAGLDDERGAAIRRYPIGLWRWLYSGSLENAGLAALDPFPTPPKSPFAWLGRILSRIF